MPTFTNRATLSYNGITVDSNVATGEIVETLTINKTPMLDEYTTSDDIGYVVNLINSGTTPITGITLTDNLGGYTFDATTVYPLNYKEGSIRYFQDGILQTAPTVTAGPPMTITGITVPAGSTVTLTYETTQTAFAPPELGSSIDNNVSVTSPDLTNPITADASVLASQSPNLRITKSIDPAVVTENSPINYTFTIENYSNTAAVAGDNVAITDTFNPILSNISVTLDGTPLPITTGYTYNTATGQFATVSGQITVPEATFTQNPATGEYTVTPGRTVLTVTGTI